MEVNNADLPLDQIATPLPPQILHYPTKKSKKHMFIIMGVVLFLILIISGIYSSQIQKKQGLVSHTTAPLTTPTTIVPSTEPFAGWKSISIGTISFKYPPEFQDPEFVATQFGQSAEIKMANKTLRIIVTSGLNQGYSEKELTEYLDMFVQIGGQRLFLDDNEAVISKQGLYLNDMNKDESSEQKITTVYMNAKDKKSQYSIAIQTSKAYDDKKVDLLLNQIFATLKFE